MKASTTTLLALAATAALAACGGPPKQANSNDDFGAASSGGDAKPDVSPSNDTPSGAPEAAPSRLNREQQGQIDDVVRRGERKVAQCPNVVPNAPTGEGEVKLTLDGKKGKVTDAVVGPPFAGTPVEACVKRAFVDEILVPFDGAPIEKSVTVKMTAKPAPVEGKKK